MFKRHAGPNLSAMLVDRIRVAGAPVEVIDRRFSRPIVIKVADVLCYVKYANLNRNGNWYFGFYPADMVDDSICDYAILLCGEGDVIRTYLTPFDEFSRFICTGTLVDSTKRSEQYQSHIFPDRGYIMKVIGNAGFELPMEPFQIHYGRIDSQLVETLLQKVRVRR